ncbi:MAG: hypothetical protein P9L94_14860 [Candidatus Hinthialibacter antarcticus]|nr:hypothetical protein [Candidatus Hinthialibacter antarcticus]
MRSFFVFMGCILTGILIVWFLMTFVLLTEEERILRVIEKGRRCVENGSVISLSNILTSDYAHEGGIDRRTALGAMRQLFQDTNNRRIQLVDREVRIDGERASAWVEFTVIADKIGNRPRDPSGLFSGDDVRTIEIELRKEKGRWRVSSSRVPR